MFARIENKLRDAMAKARDEQINVTVRFNGAVIIVTPNSQYNDLLAEYTRKTGPRR